MRPSDGRAAALTVFPFSVVAPRAGSLHPFCMLSLGTIPVFTNKDLIITLLAIMGVIVDGKKIRGEGEIAPQADDLPDDAGNGDGSDAVAAANLSAVPPPIQRQQD